MNRHFVWCVILGIGIAEGGPCCTAADRLGSNKQPLNVLFLMTDEQHFRSLSLTGTPYITTPNMDRIGREGALFANATCVTPYCSPSRASLITGVYPHRHGILVNVDGRGKQQSPLAPDAFPNTENIMHRQGYATAHFGKWHLGETGKFGCYE
jgi:arylsulfatase A-like enzyme